MSHFSQIAPIEDLRTYWSTVNVAVGLLLATAGTFLATILTALDPKIRSGRHYVAWSLVSLTATLLINLSQQLYFTTASSGVDRSRERSDEDADIAKCYLIDNLNKWLIRIYFPSVYEKKAQLDQQRAKNLEDRWKNAKARYENVQERTVASQKREEAASQPQEGARQHEEAALQSREVEMQQKQEEPQRRETQLQRALASGQDRSDYSRVDEVTRNDERHSRQRESVSRAHERASRQRERQSREREEAFRQGRQDSSQRETARIERDRAHGEISDAICLLLEHNRSRAFDERRYNIIGDTQRFADPFSPRRHVPLHRRLFDALRNGLRRCKHSMEFMRYQKLACIQTMAFLTLITGLALLGATLIKIGLVVEGSLIIVITCSAPILGVGPPTFFHFIRVPQWYYCLPFTS